jgi:hypothetical protein
MSEDVLRQLLISQIKNRALVYYAIFRELRNEMGEEKAKELMKRAIYKRGLEIGKTLTECGSCDLGEIATAFIQRIVPDQERIFEPKVIKGKGKIEILMQKCPLKDAYEEACLSEEETKTMLEIAGQIDVGTFEGAGFKIVNETWRPGRKGCCHLHIMPAE